MNSLEEKIAYKFRNSLLLAEALTHPSLAYESQRPHFDNQRLEFLGDAVLQLILTEELFHLFPQFGEGRLTKLRARLVSRNALAECASNLELGKYLMLGKGEERSGGRTRPSSLADALEALIGAIYTDSGLESARAFVLSRFSTEISVIAAEPTEINPKGELQEILQALSSTSPDYSIVSQEGPDHSKLFSARVSWENTELGAGTGASKKEAEASAADDALAKRLWDDPPAQRLTR